MRMNLKLLRVKHNLTQADVAEKCGVTVLVYRAIEKGRADGKPCFWRKVQELYNLTDAEVWGLVNENQKQDGES